MLLDHFIVQRWTLSEQRNHFLFPLNCLEIRDPFDPTEDELREILPDGMLGREDEEEAGGIYCGTFCGWECGRIRGYIYAGRKYEDGNESEWI